MEDAILNGPKGRAEILWQAIDEKWVANLLGVTLNGKQGDEAKNMLKQYKVWPYYIPDVNDENDFDQYPVELSPYAEDEEQNGGAQSDENSGKKKSMIPKFLKKMTFRKRKKKQRSLYGETRKPL